MNSFDRYCSFFNANDLPEEVRYETEKKPMRVYFDLKRNQVVCHTIISQKHRRLPPNILNVLYNSARDIYDGANPRTLRTNSETKDKRIQGIKEILLANMEQRREFDEKVDALLADEEKLNMFMDLKNDEEAAKAHKRAKRFLRKAGLSKDKINYFFTVTYDPEKYSSEDKWLNTLFRWFANNVDRYGIKIMGGVEFGDVNGRMHFHGVAIIPDDFFGDDLQLVTAYSTKRRKREERLESKEMREKFGINDWKKLTGKTPEEFVKVLHYVCDYATKQGGVMYYSRGMKDCVLQYVNVEDLIFQFDDGEMKYIPRKDFEIGKNSLTAMLRSGHYKRMGVSEEKNEELQFKLSA